MFDYTIRKSLKAKRLRITVRKDGSVIVTIPRQGTEELARRFVHEKRLWVEEKIRYMQARAERSTAFNIPKGSKKDLEENKDKARKLVETKLEHFNKSYGFTWKSVFIKNLTSRWGSCSKAGNLNFSYKIVYLPEELADYLVVHELCHLRELNHSSRFWMLVEQAIPDYKNLRKELRGIA